MKNIFQLAVLLSALVSLGQAQTLVSYNFNSGLSASTVATNIASASVFSVSDGGFTSTNFTTASPPDTPAVADSGSWDAVAPTKYFSFTITPEEGYVFSVTGITFDYRQTTSGALNYQISVGATSNAESGTFTRDSTWRIVSESLTLTDLTGATEIRIYGFGGGSGSFAIDRVTLTGTVVLTSVPEPSAFALLGGLAAVGFVASRRRRPSA